MDNLKRNIDKLPQLSGVYFFKDKLGYIIYIGKSKNLKKRVKQYFYKSKNHSPKIERMIPNIKKVDYKVTDTELEALVLESKLIKKYKPKYNSLLKNFKGYPYIKITKEVYPRLEITYNISKDNAWYFGPYDKKNIVYEVVKSIEDLFPIRKCGKDINLSSCLYKDIGKCLAPCVRENGKKYNEMINNIKKLITGEYDDLIDNIEIKMKKEAKKLNFEKAQEYKNKMNILNHIIYKQKIVSKALTEEKNIIIEETIREDIKIYFIIGGRISDKLIIDNKNKKNITHILKYYVYKFKNQKKDDKDILPQEEIDEAQIIQNWVRTNAVCYIDIDGQSSTHEIVNKLYNKIIEIFKIKTERVVT